MIKISQRALPPTPIPPPPVSFAKIDGGTVTKCNFAGDETAGASWTDKIMANKVSGEGTAKVGGQGEGADDDEWVRDLPFET